jgi:hypothetical protein
VFKYGNGGFGRLYNAWPPAKQAAEPSYLAGFASLRGEAYLVAMKAMS